MVKNTGKKNTCAHGAYIHVCVCLCAYAYVCTCAHTHMHSVWKEIQEREEVRVEKGRNGMAHASWPSLQNWFRTSTVTGAGGQKLKDVGRLHTPLSLWSPGDRMRCGAAEGPSSLSPSPSRSPRAGVSSFPTGGLWVSQQRLAGIRRDLGRCKAPGAETELEPSSRRHAGSGWLGKRLRRGGLS